jgi:hypothetical protein
MTHPIGDDDRFIRINDFHQLVFGEAGKLFALGVKAAVKIGAIIAGYGERPPAGGVGGIGNNNVPLAIPSDWPQ